MSEYTDNPVYKLMTDKLQLVLINVLQFFSSSLSIQRWVVTRYCWSGMAQ